MTEQFDFVDSHVPFDFDPERNEPWPMPIAKPPKPSLLERIGFWLGRFVS